MLKFKSTEEKRFENIFSKKVFYDYASSLR